MKKQLVTHQIRTGRREGCREGREERELFEGGKLFEPPLSIGVCARKKVGSMFNVQR